MNNSHHAKKPHFRKQNILVEQISDIMMTAVSIVYNQN